MVACLFLLDRAQHITGTRDMREIDLGLDLFFGTSGARRSCRCVIVVGVGPDMLTDEFCLVLLKRAGMRFLLRDTNYGKNVKNCLALDLQFSCQIVDSNLTHPLRFLSVMPLGTHINLALVECK
jgi:hypothetical protein